MMGIYIIIGDVSPEVVKKGRVLIFSPRPTPFPGPGELCFNPFFKNI